MGRAYGISQVQERRWTLLQLIGGGVCISRGSRWLEASGHWRIKKILKVIFFFEGFSSRRKLEVESVGGETKGEDKRKA